MAKERNLPQKTTLTTSDFIRVVGSDNASYKQNVQNVMNAFGCMHSISGNVSSFDGIPDGVSCGYLLDSTGVQEGWYLCLKMSATSSTKELYLFATGNKKIYTSQYRNSAWTEPTQFLADFGSNINNLDTMLTAGYGYTNNATGAPPNVSNGFVLCYKCGAVLIQFYVPYHTANVYIRQYIGSWSSWILMPTRAEVDAIANRKMLRYTVTIPSITIGSGGYTSISSYYPGAQTGYAFLTAVCYNFGSISPASAFTVLGNSNYVAGEPNATITNLQIAYIYAPAVEGRP